MASGEATKLKRAKRACQRLVDAPAPDYAQGPQGQYFQALFSASLEVKEPSLQKRESERSSKEPQQVQWRQRSNLDNYNLDG